jgi:flavin-dependent dehydrogenase
MTKEGTEMEHKDAKQLIILGGGPAGCAAALGALSEGHREILIIEKEPFGRHRIGEILLTQTVLEMKALGVASEMHEYAIKHEWGRKFAAAYVHGKSRKPWRVQNNHPIASSEDQPHIPREYIDPKTGLWYTLMVRRHEFDEALREILGKRGVKFLHGAVKEVKWANQESQDASAVVKLTVMPTDGGEEVVIRPKFVIDATGQHAFLPRAMGVRQKLADWDHQARYTYFKDVNFDRAMENGFFKEGANILSYQDGWSWIAYLGRGITSVGIVSKIWNKESESFYEKLKNLPEYKTFGFDEATVIDCYGKECHPEHFYAHHNYRYRSLKMRGTNWACAGDAAMFLDPLLSQGVTLAMSFGAQLGKTATHILNDTWEPLKALSEYEHMYTSELEVLNKVISQWYEPDFGFDNAWASTAQKINRLFDREIGEDVEAFRWVSNLENIHHVIREKNDKAFLSQLNDVNTIKAIHRFEDSGLISI